MGYQMNDNEKQKILIDNKYKNMSSLLQEVRSIDQLALISVAGLWGWIFSQQLTVFSHFHLLPTCVLFFYYGKTLLLLKAYKEEKKEYKELLIETKHSKSKNNTINNYFYLILISVNIVYTLHLYINL